MKFEEKVYVLLEEEGSEFIREAFEGGSHTDLLVSGPNNKNVILELKNWNPKNGKTEVCNE